MGDTVIVINNNSAQALRAFVQRVERVNEEIKEQNEVKRDIWAEAKAAGFDVSVLKKVVARRNKDKQAVEEFDLVLETYERALDGVTDAVDMGPDTSVPSESDYARAKEIILDRGYCSVSMLQNAMNIGYNKAAGLVDRLEAARHVTKPDATGKRQVIKGRDPDPDFLDD